MFNSIFVEEMNRDMQKHLDKELSKCEITILKSSVK